MTPLDVAVHMLDSAIELILQLVGPDRCRQTVMDRITVAVARAAADQAAAARFGKEPPP